MITNNEYVDDSIDVLALISSVIIKAETAIDHHKTMVCLFGKKYKRIFIQLKKEKSITLCFDFLELTFFAKSNSVNITSSVIISENFNYQDLYSITMIKKAVNNYSNSLGVYLLDFDNYLDNIKNHRLNIKQITTLELINAILNIENYTNYLYRNIDIIDILLNFDTKKVSEKDCYKLVSYCIYGFGDFDYISDKYIKNITIIIKKSYDSYQLINSNEFPWEFKDNLSLYYDLIKEIKASKYW